MKKRIIVISLGGSVIAPEKIDVNFLINFKKIIKKHLLKYKFVIVCGGGETARKYISALSKINTNKKIQSYIGIASTRLNAEFMSYFFNKDLNHKIPFTLNDLKKHLKKEKVVFCGALEYKPSQTSDSTTAEIAQHFKSEFINITNVLGLFNVDPKKNKNAKLISLISWKEFYEKANKIQFKPGEHFVLDQTASEIIMKNKIKTYIIGKDTNQLDNLLNGKKFKGTTISN